MPVVKCKNCDLYDPIIHSCMRIDSEAGDFVSYVFDDCWCSTEEGAVPISDDDFRRKWYGPSPISDDGFWGKWYGPRN